MTTIIVSNGSKWAGESPDPIEKLYERLQNYPLDPTFEKYGNFILSESRDGMAHFWGNFWHVSAVFNVYTDERDVIDSLTAYIRDNQRRQDYRKAVTSIEQARKDAEEYHRRRAQDAVSARARY